MKSEFTYILARDFRYAPGMRKMIDNLNELLSEYDQIAHEVQTARRTFFEARLARFFAFLNDEDDNIKAHIEVLRQRYTMEKIRQEVLFERDGMGADIIRLPSNILDQLSVHLNIFGAMADGALSAEDFSVQYFRSSERNLEIILRNMADCFFAPFAKELRRYIKKSYDEDPPSTLFNANEIAAPASDRSVPINHNSREYLETDRQIAELIELLRSTNDYDDADEKAQRTAELEAGRQILRAPKARSAVIETVLKYCLTTLAKKFADTAIGAAVLALIAGLGRLTGLW